MPDPRLAATDEWFLAHGLPYFVPERRAGAQHALRLGRTLPLVVLTGLAAAGAGVVVARVSDQLTFAPATLVTLGLLAAAWYALTALNAGPIVRWALHRAFGSLRTVLPMMTRALPLLLIFVTFLFINAEVWQVSSRQDGAALWLVVVLFGVLATLFLLVRLPEEVDRTDDEVDDALLLLACQGTPLEEAAREVVDDADADPAAYAEIHGFERWNLVLVLLVTQAVQVLLLSATVFLFFMLFGSMVMRDDVVETWIGEETASLTVELFQVSIFLAAFSALYLTVATVTDETYREQFFGTVVQEMEQAVGMRAVYLALRERADRDTTTGGA
ncbi:hypothetical protein GCM10023339_77870 [Alloalcanivorax gelatiniphagus]